jgi:hypothetical protein
MINFELNFNLAKRNFLFIYFRVKVLEDDIKEERR